MSWSRATAPDRPAAKKGPLLRASVAARKGGDYVMLVTFNRELLQQIFAGSLTDRPLLVEGGRGEHQGRLRLSLAPDGPLRAGRGPRGSARITLRVVDAHLKRACPSPLCGFHPDGNALIVTLPSWAQPEAAKAALDQEFGIKTFSPAKSR